MEKCAEIVYNSLISKIREAENLRQRCVGLHSISGKTKLLHKIESELRFLCKLKNHPEKLTEELLRSSNLCYLAAVVQCCSELPGVIKIFEPFKHQAEAKPSNQCYITEKRVIVDIVSDHGRTWVKVVARNPRTSLQSILGAGKFGRRSIIEQVEDLKACANQNLYMFTCPRILVCFAAGVAHHLSTHLKEMGVTVSGTFLDDDNCVGGMHLDNVGSPEINGSADTPGESSRSNNSVECQGLSPSKLNLGHSSTNLQEADDYYLSEIYGKLTCNALSTVHFSFYPLPPETTLNLDVSTMIAQVSNVTNGFNNFLFQEEILSEQAGRERQFPVRKILDKLFKAHKLVCCQTAYHDFSEILSTVGGEKEKIRASKMLADILVVPDNPSPRALALQTSSKVRIRSQIIFGTGDNMKAVTLTANLGFLRSSQSQGVKFVAVVHESRALTEQKEKTAQFVF